MVGYIEDTINLADNLIPNRRLDDYRLFTPSEQIDEIKKQAASFTKKRLVRVNATAFGGGIAEMIPFFLALLGDLGIECHWLTLDSPWGKEKGFVPPDEFFGITSGLHYALQDGKRDWLAYKKRDSKLQPRKVSRSDKKLYLKINHQLSRMLIKLQKEKGQADFVINDDPQPLATVKVKMKGQKWFWRFHPFGDPTSSSWKFVEPFAAKHDVVVSTLKNYLPKSLKEKVKIGQNFPFIDPFHKKLQKMSPADIETTLAKFGIDPDKPILAQVSRFDWDKDPLGVIEVYRLLRKKYASLQLVYTGPFVCDNPTSTIVLDEMKAKIDKLGFELGKEVFFLHNQTKPDPFYYRELAALWQSPKSYIIQLSVKEGFGMVVAEGAWCGNPIVGTSVGGIAYQISHGKTGFLVESKAYEQVVHYVSWLIEDDSLCGKMGQLAKEFVGRKYLITSNILRWLQLFNQP